MWTVVRFELRAGPRYAEAFDLLRAAGFQPHRRPAPDTTDCLPAAVVRDLFQDPAVVSRAVFEALDDAGLAPVGVLAAHVDVGRAPRVTRALAPR
jgi:hypothetical protein